MSRTKGSRDREYEQRRAELLAQARARLATGEARPSFRDLAQACGVSPATLRHYFADRGALVAAVLAEERRRGDEHLATMARPSGPFPVSVKEALDYFAFGLRMGVADDLAIGLREGMGEPVLGPAFLDHVLEAALQAVQRRLDAHVAAGDMREGSTRYAALALLAPLMLLDLHQNALSGATNHPLAIDNFITDHAAAFVRAYGTEPEGGGD